MGKTKKTEKTEELLYNNNVNTKADKKNVEENKINYPTKLRQSIGNKVRTKRQLEGLTQEQLANLICKNHPARIFDSSTNKNDDGTPEKVTKHAISNQDISNVENGKSNYGIVQLELLSEALNISAFDFFDTTLQTTPKVSENLNKDSHEIVTFINNTLNNNVINGTLSQSDLEYILYTITMISSKNSDKTVDTSTSEKFYD